MRTTTEKLTTYKKQQSYMAWALLSAVTIIVILCFFLDSCESQKNEIENLYKASNDTLLTFQNKEKEWVAKKNVLEASNYKMGVLYANSEKKLTELNRMLQKENKRLISATHIQTKTETVVVVKTDTVIHVVDKNPTYTASDSTEWYSFKAKVNDKEFELRHTSFNKFDITTQYERDKWYKSKHPVIEVVNLNPSTRTLDIQSFQIKADKSVRKWKWGVGGAIAGLIAGLIVK